MLAPSFITTVSGSLVQSDSLNNAIRRVTLPGGVVTTLAGGEQGYTDGFGTAVGFYIPIGVAMDAAGSFALVVDSENENIRRIDTASGQVTTIAGLRLVAGIADGLGTTARFLIPRGVSLSPTGDAAYIVSTRDGSCGCLTRTPVHSLRQAEYGSDRVRSVTFVTMTPAASSSASASASSSNSASASTASTATATASSSASASVSFSASPSPALSPLASRTASRSKTPSPAPPPPPADNSGSGNSAALGVGLGVGIPLGLLVLGGVALWVASARAGVPALTLLARTFGLGGGMSRGGGGLGKAASSSISTARAAQLASSSSSYQSTSDRASLLPSKGSYGGIGGV